MVCKASGYWISNALGILVWCHIMLGNIVMKWLACLSVCYGVTFSSDIFSFTSRFTGYKYLKSHLQRYFLTCCLKMFCRQNWKQFLSFIIHEGDFSESVGTRHKFFLTENYFYFKTQLFSSLPTWQGSLDWLVHGKFHQHYVCLRFILRLLHDSSNINKCPDSTTCRDLASTAVYINI